MHRTSSIDYNILSELQENVGKLPLIDVILG
jgi:hypothetical protein